MKLDALIDLLKHTSQHQSLVFKSVVTLFLKYELVMAYLFIS